MKRDKRTEWDATKKFHHSFQWVAKPSIGVSFVSGYRDVLYQDIERSSLQRWLSASPLTHSRTNRRET